MANPVQSIGPFSVQLPTILPAQDLQAMHRQLVQAQASLQQQLNSILAQIVTGIDSTKGFRGTVAIHNTVDLQGNPMTVGPASAPTHAIQSQQAVTLAPDPSHRGQLQFNASGLQIFGLQDGNDPNDAVTVGQLTKALLALLATGQVLTTNAPTIVNAGDVAAVGTELRAAHADHRHAVNTAVVGNLTTVNAGDSAAAGTAVTLPRGDHRHAVNTALVADLTTVNAGDSAAAGIALSLPRGDHRHAVNTALVGDIASVGDAASAGTAVTLPRGDHVHPGVTLGTAQTITARKTFQTDLVCPLVIGGTGVGSALTLKSTGGVGTTDFINFLVGNNGATEAVRIVSSGNVGFGVSSGLTGTSRIFLGGGTAEATTDWALTSGWGANATISAVSGNDVRGTVTVSTSALDTPANSPVITLTFKNGTWTTAPFAVVCMNGNSTGPMNVGIVCSTTATTLVITYTGTPTPLTAATYIFDYIVLG